MVKSSPSLTLIAMTIKQATFGGGCFWCVEAAFLRLNGVKSVISGYAGGHDKQPTYEQVCNGGTGHAEVIQITFDSDLIDFKTLLAVFFTVHDPTTLNRQGNDVGSQYRSIILYHDNEQQQQARQMLQELTEQSLWNDPIVTEIKALETFYPAENYHQNFYAQNPDNRYCNYVIPPKLEKLTKHFATLLK